MTKPTKKGTHKETKTGAKTKTIDRPSQIDPDTKRSHKARKRKLIPARQAAYYILAFGFSAATIALFPVEANLSKPLLTRPYNFYRLAIIILAIVFLLLATKSSWSNTPPSHEPSSRARRWLLRLGIALPIIALVFLVIQLVTPQFATLLVRKESWPFFRNAIFIKSACQLVAAIAFIKVARHYFRQRQRLAMVLAIAMVLLLGLMIGEELSWGQRIFGWGTPSFLAEINSQSEINLHNINTQLAQNILYFGGWLLLIGFAFWRESLAKLLRKSPKVRLDFLIDWLPPGCFVGLFAVGFAFCDPLVSDSGLYCSSNLFIILATACLLLTELRYRLKLRSQPNTASVLDNTDNNRHQDLRLGISLLCFIVVLTGNLFNAELWNYNSGAPTEYLELFISLGIMTWALIVKSRLVKPKVKSSSAKIPRKA
ncbi:hypothetical protein HG443_002420 [Candidatus Saccharibacteria bacterium]|nr:hypothetical protein [Candidatus Saccharibacteria bacterium]